MFAVIAALFLVTAAPAAAITATGTTMPLPPGFGAITVDGATGRVFVSSPSSNTISVRNPDGTALSSLTEPGPGSMLSRDGKLYVASTTAGRIDVFDTTTLQALPPLTQGLVSPGALTFAAGRLWTTTGTCTQWNSRLVSIDPVTGTTTVQPPLSLAYCPDIVGSETAPVLIGYERGVSPTTFYRIDVSTGTASVAASYFSNSSNTKQVQFVPSGDRFVAASGAPYQLVEFRTSDLQPTGVVYPTGPYPVAVAVNASVNRLIGGTYAPYNADVTMFPVGNPISDWSFDFGTSSNVLYDRGLAWSADGSALYAVSGNEYGSPQTAQLNVFTLDKVPTTTTLQASRTETTWSEPVDLTASVSAADGSPVSGSIDFLVDGAVYATAGVVDGTAVLHNVTLPAGSHDVVARLAGDFTYAASWSSATTMTVHAASTVTQLSGSPLRSNGWVRAPYGQPATFDATVTVVETGLPAPSGEVMFRDGNQVLDAISVSNGHATLTKSDLAVGNHTITAAFVASPSASASSDSVRAQIQMADSQTELSQSKNPALPTEAVTFTAVVASSLPSTVVPTGTVTFWDQDPVWGTTVIGSANLANGRAEISASFLTPGTHTISATYSGDAGYRTSQGTINHVVGAI